MALTKITSTLITDDAVNSEHLADGGVDDAHLATDIDAGKLINALPALDGSNLTGIAVTMVSDTTPQLGGELDGRDNIISKVNLKDYGIVTVAKGDTSGADITCDIQNGNSFTATISTNAVTFTFSNPTATDEFCGFSLVLTNGGSQTVNWPASVDWEGGSAPSLTSSGVDILYFFTVNGGTIWYGTMNSLNAS